MAVLSVSESECCVSVSDCVSALRLRRRTAIECRHDGAVGVDGTQKYIFVLGA